MILAFDCSGKSVSAAVCDEKSGNPLAARFSEGGGPHSVTLMPLIDEVLKEAGVTVKDLSFAAVTVGPGSFTGVRIGVSLAKGLLLPYNIPVKAVSSLEAAAESVKEDGVILALSDARRERFYFAFFERKGGVLTRLSEDAVDGFGTVSAHADFYGATVTGDGALLFKELCKKDCKVRPFKGVDALDVCLVSLKKEAVDVRKLAPVYLALPQAERERNARLAAEK